MGDYQTGTHPTFFRTQRCRRWANTYQVLRQTEIWRDMTGELHRIDDMSVEYKVEVVGWLQDRIPMLRLDYLFGRTVMDSPGDFFTHEAQQWAEVAFDHEQLEIAQQHPAIWFEDLPLVKRLRFDILHGIGGTSEQDAGAVERVWKRIAASLN